MTAFVGPSPQSHQDTQCAPDQELLDDGQAEVFSRSEVENGVIEHGVEAGGATGAGADPSP